MNLKPLISNAQQRKIAEVYLSAYLRATLKGESRYIPLFWDARLAQAWLPGVQSLGQFEDSRTVFVYSRKNDLNIAAGTLPGSTISQDGLTVWRQQKVLLKRGDQLDNAIVAGWVGGQGSLAIGLPRPDSFLLNDRSVLTFSLADAHESPQKDDESFVPWNQPIDFTVEVGDASGEKAALPLSHVSFLLPQIDAQVYKNDAFDYASSGEPIFQSFRFPLADFIKVNPKLNAKDLSFVRFVFDKTATGVIMIDRIGFN